MSKGGSSAGERARKVSLVCPACGWRTRRIMDVYWTGFGACSRCGPPWVRMVRRVLHHEARRMATAQRELKGGGI
mgnify:CR=1 FL=1